MRTSALRGTPAGLRRRTPAIDELLSRVGERIAEFYKRAQHVICIETSRVQPIDHSYLAAGFRPDGRIGAARRSRRRRGCRRGDGRAGVRKVNGRCRARRQEESRRLHRPESAVRPSRSRFCCGSPFRVPIQGGGIAKDRNRTAVSHRFRIGQSRNSSSWKLSFEDIR
jgi:hypothetical protein